MGREIERKFLLRGDAWRAHAKEGVPYRQAYLSSDERHSVRVRLAGDRAWLTVKGPTEGASRDEFEYLIPVADAHQMMDRLCGDEVKKTRYVVPFEGHDWEIDVFDGDNAGLVVAEVELDDEAEPVTFPDWAGDEVTSDARYRNAALAKAPYRTWRDRA